MNKSQQKILYISISIFFLLIAVWFFYGAEIFTKTQILVESKNELFGWTEKKWIDKFIWGLDLSLILSGVTFLVGGILFFLNRTKKKKLEKGMNDE